MRRTERLFQIIQILRREKRPVTGRALAEELEISLRSLYRDMAELIAQRVPVRGEAGTGYILEQGFDLPPMMLTPDEIEAAVLGAAWVARRGDPALARAARDLVAKIEAAIPAGLRPLLLDAGLKPIILAPAPPEHCDSSSLRIALREGHKISITYEAPDGAISQRVIWPILIAYTDEVRILAAWCELRDGFRSFRTDRIRRMTILGDRVPGSRNALRARWQAHVKANPAPPVRVSDRADQNRK